MRNLNLQNSMVAEGYTQEAPVRKESTVTCGACLRPNIRISDAPLKEYKPFHYAHICRECLNTYQEVTDYIRAT